jgi:hypothetical protein
VPNKHLGNTQPAIDQEEHAHIGGVAGKKSFIFDASGNQIIDFVNPTSSVTVEQGNAPWTSIASVINEVDIRDLTSVSDSVTAVQGTVPWTSLASVINTVDVTSNSGVTVFQGDVPWVSQATVQVFGSQMAPLQQDASTNAVTQIDYEHHETHGGSHYYICNHQEFSNAEVVDFTVITPDTAKWTHMTFMIEGTGATSVDIREDAAVDVAGTAVASFNNNRNSVNTTGMTIRVGDTFTDEGDLISSSYSGANKQAGFVDRNKEIVMKQNSVYIFRITNETAQVNEVNYCAEWYEHTDKN